MANEPAGPGQTPIEADGAEPSNGPQKRRSPGTGRLPEEALSAQDEAPLRPLRPKNAIRSPLARGPVTRRRLLQGRRKATRRLARAPDDANERPGPSPGQASEARGEGRDARAASRIPRLVDGVLYSRKPGGSPSTPRVPLPAVGASPEMPGAPAKAVRPPMPLRRKRPETGRPASPPPDPARSDPPRRAGRPASSRRLPALPARGSADPPAADEHALHAALQSQDSGSPAVAPARRSSSRYRSAARPPGSDSTGRLARLPSPAPGPGDSGQPAPSATLQAEQLTSTRKLLASAIDSLVRSTRLGLPNLTPLIRRSTDILRSHPGTVFEVRPTCLLVDGDPTLEADENQGTWLVPAFMAGLRGLTLREEVLEDDVRKLCTELSNLEPKLRAIDQFRDWLWSGGAEGFRVTLDQSFTETMDAITSAEDGQNPFLVSPEKALHSQRALGTLRPAWERDPQQRPSPYQLALQQFSRRARSKKYVLTKSLRSQLKAKTENRGAWMGAEVDAALAIDKLREAVPPAQLASRIQSRVLDGADASVLNLVALLFRGASPHRLEVREHLLRSGIGRLIAGHLDLQDPGLLPALQDVLACAPEAVSRSAFKELLSRAADDKAFLKLCFELVRKRGIAGSRALVDEPKLDPRCALPYARILWKIAKAEETPENPAATVLDDVLGNLTPSIALSILQIFPPILSVLFQAQFGRLVVAGDEDTRRKAIELLGSEKLNGDVRWGGRVLLRALQDSQAQGWDSRSLYSVLEKLVHLGLGSQLVALGLNRSLPTTLRVGCIDVLDGQPELLAQVAQKRFTEFLEPQEVKRSLKTARIRLKETGR